MTILVQINRSLQQDKLCYSSTFQLCVFNCPIFWSYSSLG